MSGGVRKIVFPLLLLLAWAGASSSGFLPETVFPSPLMVGGKLLALFGDGLLFQAISPSLGRVLTGYALSVALGLTAGILMSQFNWAEEILGPFALVMQTLPSVAWFPLMVLWFGEREITIIIIIAFSAFGSVTLATHSGIRNIPPLLLRAARTLGASGWNLGRRVIIPAAFPSIVTGMKMGWAFSWLALVASELILKLGEASGLGILMKKGQESQEMAQVVAVLAVIVAIGLTVDRLAFARLENRFRAEWEVR